MTLLERSSLSVGPETDVFGVAFLEILSACLFDLHESMKRLESLESKGLGIGHGETSGVS